MKSLFESDGFTTLMGLSEIRYHQVSSIRLKSWILFADNALWNWWLRIRFAASRWISHNPMYHSTTIQTLPNIKIYQESCYNEPPSIHIINIALLDYVVLITACILKPISNCIQIIFTYKLYLLMLDSFFSLFKSRPINHFTWPINYSYCSVHNG